MTPTNELGEERGTTVPAPPDPGFSPRRAVFIVGAAALAVASLGIAAALWWWLGTQIRTAGEAAVVEAQEHTRQAAANIDALLAEVPADVQRIADQLQSGALQPLDVPARLKLLIELPGTPDGYGVAFETFGAGPATRLFAPYVRRNARGPATELDFAAIYPYNEYEYAWFCDTLLDGAGWMSARLFPDTQEVTAIYSVPFSLPGAEGYSGVVFASVPYDLISSALETISVGRSGYSFVVSPEGEYLVHPRQEFVRRGTTLFETAWTSGNTGLHTLGVRAIQGEEVFAESTDELTGRANWIFAEPLETTGWSLFAVFFRDEYRPDSTWERRQLFLVVIFGLVGAWLFLLAGLAIRIRDGIAFQWAGSISVALVLAAATGLSWYVAARFPPPPAEDRAIVYDQGSAHQYLMRLGFDDRPGVPGSVITIPTGVYVRSVGLQTGNEVAVSGYVWQRFETGLHDDVPRGFQLPEMFDPEQSQIEEVYRMQIDGQERIGWYFAGKFRQAFDYRKFPFDQQSVWVRLEPPDLASNVVFVPDFEAYELMNPQLRPGINDSLVLPGWNLLGSHFDYRLHSYNTDLGIPTFGLQTETPELHFNVDIRRLFLGPFVSHIVPLGVTGGMLFALLLISSRREASEGLLGFSAVEIVLGAAALFFVASFQHISLRETLAAPGLIYLEYFYFVIYVLMMLVAINAILFASAVQIRAVEYADNLIPKILFWPVCLGSLFLITLVQFY